MSNLDQALDLEQARAAWEDTLYKRMLAKAPERHEVETTLSGLPTRPVYTPLDADFSRAESYQSALGFPGQFPYTRGIQPTMYRGRLWTMRQYAGFGTAEETNTRFHYLLAQGQTGLSVAF
ncbi:MAG: methylmalonyl-CoA mutase family protein, partial [Candidatus Sericytochromatia bacterium]